MHAKPGQRIELRVERHNNQVWVTVLGMGEKPAELSQAAARYMEDALSAAGGSFTLMPLNGRLAYVAMLPLRPVADAGSTRTEVAAPAADVDGAAPLEGLFVMAIDDQEDALDALEAVLTSSGARVQTASSGKAALDWLARTPTAQWPHALLCDIVLADDEDGYDVLRRLRRLEAERQLPLQDRVPAIALTGYAQGEDRMRAKMAGFQAHLTKPVAPEKLIGEIRNLAMASARTGV